MPKVFREGCPEVEGAAHRFFSAIVEVVAEGRADLGLGLERGDQLTFHDNQKIPLLCGAEIAGEFEGFIVKDVAPIDAGIDDEFG